MITKKINNFKIKPFKNKNGNKTFKDDYIELFGNQYLTMFLCAKKGSGKSTIIGRVLPFLVSNHTKAIRFFSATFFNDLTYRNIRDKLEKYKIPIEIYQSLEPTENGYKDILEQQYSEITEEINEDETIDKKKYLFNLYVYIFDDFGEALKSNSLKKMIFNQRHLRSCFIISYQQYVGLQPGIRNNLTHLILFKDMRESTDLQTIYDERVSKKITWEDFKQIYYNIVYEKDKKNFITIDCSNTENNLRKNLNELILFSSL